MLGVRSTSEPPMLNPKRFRVRLRTAVPGVRQDRLRDAPSGRRRV